MTVWVLVRRCGGWCCGFGLDVGHGGLQCSGEQSPEVGGEGGARVEWGVGDAQGVEWISHVLDRCLCRPAVVAKGGLGPGEQGLGGMDGAPHGRGDLAHRQIVEVAQRQHGAMLRCQLGEHVVER